MNRVYNYRTSGHALNLMGRFKLDMMKKCFTVRVVKLVQVAQRGGGCHSLETFKVTLNRL